MDKRIWLAMVVLVAVVVAAVGSFGDYGATPELVPQRGQGGGDWHTGSTPPATPTFAGYPALSTPRPTWTADPTRAAMTHKQAALAIIAGMEKWPNSWNVQLPVTLTYSVDVYETDRVPLDADEGSIASGLEPDVAMIIEGRFWNMSGGGPFRYYLLVKDKNGGAVIQYWSDNLQALKALLP